MYTRCKQETKENLIRIYAYSGSQEHLFSIEIVIRMEDKNGISAGTSSARFILPSFGD